MQKSAHSESYMNVCTNAWGIFVSIKFAKYLKICSPEDKLDIDSKLLRSTSFEGT